MSTPPPWDRVQALFDEALELDPAAREARLDRAAAEDAGVAREVRSLLAAHASASGFLAGTAAHDFSRTASPGDRIGPYRIVEETGRGGMGVVFRATRDDDDFTMDVAIKLIYPGMRSDEILRRFRAERQILARLDHPFIARLIDGGTAPDGAPYLVMDFVVGRPLLRYCQERRLDVESRLAIFLGICDAVQFAHQRLVIHRDLKPDNILVTEDGSPRLLDFGIARLLTPEADGPAVTLTAPMQRLLTPDYASPEQLRGEPATLAGDVYSLGVILFELLCGRRPFQFATRAPEEILRVLDERDPPRPSTLVHDGTGPADTAPGGESAGRLRRRLVGDLDYIVLKALEREPERRYRSVDQLAEDIRRHAAGLPVLARGQSTAYLVSRFVRRHRAAVTAGALVLLSLVVGMAGITWQAGVARQERDRANRRFNDVRSLAHAVVFDLHDAIADLPGSTQARELLVAQALKYLDSLGNEVRGDLALQRELGVAYARVADVQGRPMFPNLGRSAEALGNYDRALALLRAVSAARPGSVGISRDLIVVQQRRADLLHVLGRRDEALEQAGQVRGRILAELEHHPGDLLLERDLALTCERVGDMKLAAADTAGAIAERARGVELAEASFHADPRDPVRRRAVLISSTKAGDLMAARGDRAGALACYRRAELLSREAVEALPGNTEARRDLSIVYGTLGTFLADGGEVDAGLAMYGQGMKIAEEMAAADPASALQQADVAAGHFELGEILLKARRPAEAEAHFRAACERFARLAAADSANVELRQQLARAGRAAAEARRARALKERPANPPAPSRRANQPGASLPGSASSRNSQARASVQSRLTVIGETTSTSAVSSMLRPPK